MCKMHGGFSRPKKDKSQPTIVMNVNRFVPTPSASILVMMDTHTLEDSVHTSKIQLLKWYSVTQIILRKLHHRVHVHVQVHVHVHVGLHVVQAVDPEFH